ncbi:MAG: sensor histidine kinase [Myxococcota bacterium]
MTPLYAYSLIPVISVSLLVFFTAALRTEKNWGLAAYSGFTSVWASLLLMTYFPGLESIGSRGAAAGALVAASYLHAAYEQTEQQHFALVWIAYLVAALITAAGAVFPGLLYDPATLSAGPFFWESMLLACLAATIPMFQVGRAYLKTDSKKQRTDLRLLLGAGVLGYVGAWANALMLSRGQALPYGMLLVLGSNLMLAQVVRRKQKAGEQRLLERSLTYAAVAAFVSAGFLFGILTLLSDAAEPLLTEYRLGALFLLFMALLAFEPVRQHLQELLSSSIARDQAPAREIAEELAVQEQRADQAERLAELGTFTSAIAHEVRNPLGVLSACVRVLEHDDVDQETLDEMRAQVTRAGDFLDELLAYGRPRELELRDVDIDDVIELAASSARQALSDVAQHVDFEMDFPDDLRPIEGDQGQLVEVFVVLFENAILALDDTDDPLIRVDVDVRGDELEVVVADNGPGIPDELRETLFEPFVTGRKRDGPRTGTGLGLAIAHRMVERHGGQIRAGDADTLGGAKFVVTLPRWQKVLGPAVQASRGA